jgi:hydrogenase nickel incorporation protein HypB
MDAVTLPVGQSLKAKNAALAAENRGRFAALGVTALNLLSSPGAGKTALLERTLADLAPRLRAAVIVGDLATDNDAQRLRRTGAPAVQISTGNVCHLDASMVAKACTQIDLDRLDILFIENVGNLVCPAAYDLGESARVVLFSVTEGEDKPLKYPTIFKSADVVVLTKIDLMIAAGCDREATLANIAQVAPQARVLELSARTGAGMTAWHDFLASMVPAHEDR